MSDTTTDSTDDRIFALVRDDVTPALDAAFGPGTFTRSPELPTSISADRHTALAWEYHGRERLNPLARKAFDRERRDVIVRGITVVVESDSPEVFHRYIDWAGVYDQLGMVPGRPGQGLAQAATIARDESGALILIGNQPE